MNWLAEILFRSLFWFICPACRWPKPMWLNGGTPWPPLQPGEQLRECCNKQSCQETARDRYCVVVRMRKMKAPAPSSEPNICR